MLRCGHGQSQYGRHAAQTGPSRVHPSGLTTVVIITIAFLVGTLALILGNWPMFWVGAGLVVVGAVVGKIMQKPGSAPFPDADLPDPDESLIWLPPRGV